MPTILGIDPGTHRLGWALLAGTLAKPTLLQSGCLQTPAHAPSSTYLPLIYTHLQSLLERYRPSYLALETLVFARNKTTALSVAQSRGVILLTAAQTSLPVLELAPNQVKLAVAGHGHASKQELRRMLRLLLKQPFTQTLDDELDAVAIALTALSSTFTSSYT